MVRYAQSTSSTRQFISKSDMIERSHRLTRILIKECQQIHVLITQERKTHDATTKSRYKSTEP